MGVVIRDAALSSWHFNTGIVKRYSLPTGHGVKGHTVKEMPGLSFSEREQRTAGHRLLFKHCVWRVRLWGVVMGGRNHYTVIVAVLQIDMHPPLLSVSCLECHPRVTCSHRQNKTRIIGLFLFFLFHKIIKPRRLSPVWLHQPFRQPHPHVRNPKGFL